jgi:uncharacterized membrane protein (UPF0127 family)
MNLKKQQKDICCVFNKTRESFLSLNVAVADTHFKRLKGLAWRLRLKSDEGVWIIPSQGVHTIGVLFPIDLIYLDANHRVIHLIESFGTFHIAPIRLNCASVLELSTRTIYSSMTKVGDQLLICTPDELAQHLEKERSREGAAAGRTSSSPSSGVVSRPEADRGKSATASQGYSGDGSKRLLSEGV